MFFFALKIQFIIFYSFSDTDECKVNNGGCHHHCHDKDIGFECKCRIGFKLASDNKTCEDLDDCKEFGICSQQCINTKGSYKCECGQGYALTANKRSCKAEGKIKKRYLIDRFFVRHKTFSIILIS